MNSLSKSDRWNGNCILYPEKFRKHGGYSFKNFETCYWKFQAKFKDSHTSTKTKGCLIFNFGDFFFLRVPFSPRIDQDRRTLDYLIFVVEGMLIS